MQPLRIYHSLNTLHILRNRLQSAKVREKNEITERAYRTKISIRNGSRHEFQEWKTLLSRMPERNRTAKKKNCD